MLMDFPFIYDFELNSLIEGSSYENDMILRYHDYLPAINNLYNSSLDKNLKIKRSSAGKLVY